ncbi:MMPL family transporter [Terrilactibacillus sp. BCM23-1]|uniref:MMPL family transporter n=1 Tax=Terrilactibacillus tamarindi TaxID=2599694 RepID=A0A6N8CMN3_9BACI|nr:efflux RND transporter permease subunit [Terrilactibacillus tamarindi]MTT30780.1 MMPL family transporter [Terrilactibacillus tamarindi]
MKSIINFSTKNKYALWLLTIIVVVAGLYSGSKMKMETMPNMSFPVLTITTMYPGGTPTDINDKITTPIEQRISHLSGVENVSSTTNANVSSIQVEYNYDKDMDKAVTEVKEAVDKIDLPDNVETPNVSKINFNAFPVLSVSVSNENASLSELTSKVEDDLVPTLEGIDGISTVTVSGQEQRQILLTFDDKKLKHYGLTQDTVTNMIKGANVSMPLGLYTIGNQEQSVAVNGDIKTLHDLENIEIPVQSQMQQSAGQGQMQGQAAPQTQVKPAQLPTITLKDVAKLQLDKKAESISRTNGQESIGVSIVKADDANTVDVVKEANAKLKKFSKDNNGIHTVNMYDQAKPIQDSVKTMIEKAILGAIFAVIIIMLFLRNIRSTIISIFSIPLSLLMALIVLKQMDVTLNIMTLGAMTVAIGRVVDDSIVVIENIYRRLTLSTEKLKGTELIREATREMFIPIMSSTIVTIAVFLPMALVSGVVGQIFLPFALTIVCSLLASLLVAITIVPMLADSLFKNGVKKAKEHKEIGKLSSFYKRVLNGALNHKLITFGIAVLALVGSLFLVPKIGFSFLASDSEKMLTITYSPNPGQRLSDVEAVALKAEKYLEDNKHMTKMQYSVGGENPMNPAASNQALFYVMYEKDTPNFDKLADKTMKDLAKISNKGKWGQEDMGGGTSGSNNTLTLYVYGDSMEQIKPIVKQVESKMKQQKNLTNIDSSLTQAYSQFNLVVDKDKLSQLGLTAGQVAGALANTGESQTLTTIKQNGKELNVYVKNAKSSYKDIDDVMAKTLTSPLGREVPIKDVVKVEKGKTANSLTKRNGKFSAQVSAKVTSADVSQATSDLKAKVDKIKTPNQASISFGGVTEQMNESFSQLGMAILAAIAIVYFVLVVTFGGGLAPFAILFSLPFTIIGGLLALFISGETISVSAMIGVLMLIGIVVTNAIVLIDRVIHMEKAGLSTREALLEAGATRLRPILMTAIATIGALIPLAIGAEGSGGLISKGLGVTVIGGITSSTLLTLVVVPIVYEFLMKMSHRKGKKKKAIEE